MLALLIAANLVVVDGDSLRMGQERLRLAGIDAPELQGQCPAERAAAQAARAELKRLVAAAPDLSIERLGQDRFGRTRAVVRVGGVNVADALVSKGLAARVAGKRIGNWCKKLAPKLNLDR